ncbi:insulinase family protein [Patescibacteria group bacterium]|nr:insulinase family protein [Patescibacteria group bacterium]
MKYVHKQFENGLTVLLMPSDAAESVFVNILVKVGSRYERSEVSGVSHFLEHIFFKGSKKYPQPTDIAQTIDAIGGDFNAATSKETTEFYIKAEKHHLDLIFGVLTDMMQNPLFDPAEIEKEKGVVIEEINQYQDSPSDQVESNLEQAMWPGSALGREIIGTKETVTALTRDKIAEYKDIFYQPENIILGISGNFDTEAVMKKAEAAWAHLPNTKTPKFEPISIAQKTPQLNIEYKDTQQAHLSLGFLSYEHDHKKNPAALVLACILGGNMSSRLFVKIREQKGLAYYVSASNTPYFNTGNFTIHAGLRIADTLHALEEIVKELRLIKSEAVSEQELQRAKDFIKGKTAIAFENIHRQLDWIMNQFAFAEHKKTLREFLDEVEKVTAQDVLDVADEIFAGNRATLAVIGPFKDTAVFENLLKI